MNTSVASRHQWLNLGCGKFPLEGYINVDLHEAAHADVVGDVWGMAFSNLACVKADHFLEHFSHRETVPLLRMIRGWMMRGGALDLEVPDMELIMAAGSQGDWLRQVYGSQQHEGEFHKAGFTSISLFDAISDAGFQDVRISRMTSTFQTRKGMPCLHGTARA